MISEINTGKTSKPSSNALKIRGFTFKPKSAMEMAKFQASGSRVSTHEVDMSALKSVASPLHITAQLDYSKVPKEWPADLVAEGKGSRWFRFDLTRAEAEENLQSLPNDSVLCRQSSIPACLALTFKRNDAIGNALVEFSTGPNGKTQYKLMGTTYSSMKQLLADRAFVV